MTNLLNTSKVTVRLTKKAKKLKKKIAKEKLKKTALKAIYKNKDVIRKTGHNVLSILIYRMSNVVNPYGIDIKMKGSFLNVMVNAMSIKELVSMSYGELPFIKKLFLDDELLIHSFQPYEESYAFSEYLSDVLPLLGLVHYISSMFEPKLERIEQYMEASTLDMRLLKTVAYFHKIGLIELSANENIVGSEMIVKKLKLGISGYTTKESIKNQSVKNIKTHKYDVNIFDNLINNAYRVKFISGKNGKHAFHKSPEPHLRKEHWKITRNGKKILIPATWVNGHFLDLKEAA